MFHFYRVYSLRQDNPLRLLAHKQTMHNWWYTMCSSSCMQYILDLSHLQYLFYLKFFKLEVREAQRRTANGHPQQVLQQQAHVLTQFAQTQLQPLILMHCAMPTFLDAKQPVKVVFWLHFHAQLTLHQTVVQLELDWKENVWTQLHLQQTAELKYAQMLHQHLPLVAQLSSHQAPAYSMERLVWQVPYLFVVLTFKLKHAKAWLVVMENVPQTKTQPLIANY